MNKEALGGKVAMDAGQAKSSISEYRNEKRSSPSIDVLCAESDVIVKALGCHAC